MENIALIGIVLVRTLSIFTLDHRGKAVYRKNSTRPKLIEFQADTWQQPSRWKPAGSHLYMSRLE